MADVADGGIGHSEGCAAAEDRMRRRKFTAGDVIALLPGPPDGNVRRGNYVVQRPA